MDHVVCMKGGGGGEIWNKKMGKFLCFGTIYHILLGKKRFIAPRAKMLMTRSQSGECLRKCRCLCQKSCLPLLPVDVEEYCKFHCTVEVPFV